jgi:O-acetyl-ADP-ribose deacetylase (regulator of RNase III)
MSEIKYIEGNAVKPEGDGPKFIIHCCNDIGGWGSGFVLAISDRWTEPEKRYREWAHKGSYINQEKYDIPFKLGQVQGVEVEDDLYVVNMIGQRSTGMTNIAVGDEIVTIPPIKYDCISECLLRVASFAMGYGASIHMPRICCGLAGGTWDRVEPLIMMNLCKYDIPVTIYDYKG